MPGQGALYARRVLLGHVPCLEMQQDFFPQRGVLVWSAATGNRQTESVLTDQKSLRSRTWSGVAAALVFGALPALAFPAPSWWWLAWFGIVPLLLVVRAAPTARAAALRSCCGMAGYILATQYWLLPSTGPLLIVLAIGLGALWLPWGLAAYLLLGEPITARGTLAAMAVLPSAWVMAEAVRSWPSLGGPWASLGASQWNQPATLASASLGGVWLTTFVIVGANTAIAGVILPVGTFPPVSSPQRWHWHVRAWARHGSGWGRRLRPGRRYGWRSFSRAILRTPWPVRRLAKR